MENITLYNRDGANLSLYSEDNIHWFFNVDEKHKFVMENIRCGYQEDNTIHFIDPAGGPFIQIGDKIKENKTVIEIRIEKEKFCIITN